MLVTQDITLGTRRSQIINNVKYFHNKTLNQIYIFGVYNFQSLDEINEIKKSWSRSILDNTALHGMNIFIKFFKLYPEIRGQYFGFLANLTEEELRKSPRLTSHASGVILGVTHIINGLENPVVFFFSFISPTYFLLLVGCT